MGWRMGNMCEALALGSIPSTKKKKKKECDDDFCDDEMKTG
jgi:hypothetical protein